MTQQPLDTRHGGSADADVEALREAYRLAYGKELTPEDARVWLTRLGRLYVLLAEPTPSELAEVAKSQSDGTLKVPSTPVVVDAGSIPLTQ